MSYKRGTRQWTGIPLFRGSFLEGRRAPRKTVGARLARTAFLGRLAKLWQSAGGARLNGVLSCCIGGAIGQTNPDISVTHVNHTDYVKGNLLVSRRVSSYKYSSELFIHLALASSPVAWCSTRARICSYTHLPTSQHQPSRLPFA